MIEWIIAFLSGVALIPALGVLIVVLIVEAAYYHEGIKGDNRDFFGAGFLGVVFFLTYSVGTYLTSTSFFSLPGGTWIADIFWYIFLGFLWGAVARPIINGLIYAEKFKKTLQSKKERFECQFKADFSSRFGDKAHIEEEYTAAFADAWDKQYEILVEAEATKGQDSYGREAFFCSVFWPVDIIAYFLGEFFFDIWQTMLLPRLQNLSKDVYKAMLLFSTKNQR